MTQPARSPIDTGPTPAAGVSATRRSGSRVLPLALAAALGGVALPATGAQAADPGDSRSHAHAARTSPTTAPAPAAAAPDVLAAPVTAAARLGGPTYTVRPGDTIGHISIRTGIRIADLLAANGLDSGGFIRAGQVLVLGGPPPAPASTPASNGYRVRAGDTVSHIAARLGVSVTSVLQANGLTARSIIRPGQVLDIPGPARPTAGPAASRSQARTSPVAGAASYTVRAGDTLGHIAGRNQTTVAALRTVNPGLDRRGTIRVGQALALPGVGAPVPATPMPDTFAGRSYPAVTVAAATANRDVLATRPVPTREQMRTIIADAARAQGVDAALAQAVGFQESGFSMRAVSPANAVGAMQVIPSSGRWAAQLVGRPLDLLDPHDNATAGTAILAALVRTSATRAEAIAGYYQGQASVRSNGMYPDTRRYVANVQTLTGRFR